MPKGRGFTPLSVSVAQAEDGVGVGFRQIFRPLGWIHAIISLSALIRDTIGRKQNFQRA